MKPILKNIGAAFGLLLLAASFHGCVVGKPYR